MGRTSSITFTGRRSPTGDDFLVATELLAGFFERTGLGPHAEGLTEPFELKEHALGTYRGSDLAGTVARHPMHQLGGFFAEAPPVPARRLRHHRQRHRPGPYGARPWRG